MNRSPANKPLSWSEVGVLAMLSWLVVFGLAAHGRTFWESVVSIGFLAAGLFLAWAWQRTCRQEVQRRRPAEKEQVGGDPL
jgi:hypothetical protein